MDINVLIPLMTLLQVANGTAMDSHTFVQYDSILEETCILYAGRMDMAIEGGKTYPASWCDDSLTAKEISEKNIKIFKNRAIKNYAKHKKPYR